MGFVTAAGEPWDVGFWWFYVSGSVLVCYASGFMVIKGFVGSLLWLLVVRMLLCS